MFKKLIRWFRPIECNNFDCWYEWNGVCRAEKLELQPITFKIRAALVCSTFEQVPEG